MILGGIRRIARFSGVLMPVSAGIYFLFSMIVILASRELLPDIFRTILKEALRPEAAAGGIGGTMISAGMRYGLSRGTFSNEAGLGSLAVLHGTPENTTPEQQGMWAMFAVFLDTMVLCTLTALVVLCTAASGQLPAGLDGAALAAWCYARRLGVSGTVLVSGAMAVFAFATIVAWYYVGEQMVDYLQRKAGTRWQHIPAGSIYRGLYLAMVCLGCVSSVRAVWMISDIWNGCMAFPNLLALLLLSRQVKRPGGKVGCT
jgi:AGCS family alanine or glycine:cation symporter